MDTVQEAIKKFEELGFNSIDYIPYEAPIGNQEEIQKLEGRLGVLSKDRFKERAFLEYELELQTKGIEERVEAVKSFKRFKGFKWISDETPYIISDFNPQKYLYRLTFHARFPEVIEDIDFFQVHFGMRLSLDNFGNEEDDAKRIFNEAIQIGRKIHRINDDIKISPPFLYRGLTPPFNLSISSNNLSEAYEKLSDAMNKVGYRDGVSD